MKHNLVTDASDVEADSAPQEVEPKSEQQTASTRDVHGVKVRDARSLYKIPRTKTNTNILCTNQWALVVIGTLSSIFLYALDNTVVADVTPVSDPLRKVPTQMCCGDGFANASLDTREHVWRCFEVAMDLSWVSLLKPGFIIKTSKSSADGPPTNSFLLGGTAAVLPFGRIYGLFDAKWLYVISALVFNAGSALCGAAPNMNAVIVGRVLAGLGGNGMYLGVMTLLSVLTTDRERPGYLSFVGLFWGIGIILGPVVGGAFTQSSATWRWAFYINLCVAGLFAPVYLFWIPSFKPRAGSKSSALLHEIDSVGTILSIAGLMTIIMAINFGGTIYPWNSGSVIALFVVSGVIWITFGIQQTYSIFTTETQRVFPIHFLKNLNAVLLFISMAAVNVAGFIPIYYVPIYFQFSRGDDAIQAAVRLLPLIFVLSATILCNGHLMSRFNYFQPWYIFGSILTLIGGVLLSRVTATTSTGSIYGFEVLIGVGTGCFIQAGYAVIQAIVPPAEMAYAISFMMLAQLGGVGLGLSIGGSVFINQSVNNLAALLPGVSRADLQLAISGTSSSYFQSLDPAQRDAAVDVIVGGLSHTFVLIYVGGAVCLVTSVLFTRRKLFKGAVAIAA